VGIPIDQKYVALSYIWGSVPTVHLLKKNMSRLMFEGSGSLQISLTSNYLGRNAIGSVDEEALFIGRYPLSSTG
jgi:hypothetical protein